VNVDADHFPLSVCGNPSKSILPTVLQNQHNGVRQTSAGLFLGSPLSVRPRYLRAIRDDPVIVGLEDGGEFVPHVLAAPKVLLQDTSIHETDP
jgi:hypothetical protein